MVIAGGAQKRQNPRKWLSGWPWRDLHRPRRVGSQCGKPKPSGSWAMLWALPCRGRHLHLGFRNKPCQPIEDQHAQFYNTIPVLQSTSLQKLRYCLMLSKSKRQRDSEAFKAADSEGKSKRQRDSEARVQGQGSRWFAVRAS